MLSNEPLTLHRVRLGSTTSNDPANPCSDAALNVERSIDNPIDGAGRRVGRVERDFRIAGPPDVEHDQRWVYGDALNPIAELDAAHPVTQRYVYGSRTHIADCGSAFSYADAAATTPDLSRTYREVSHIRRSVCGVVEMAAKDSASVGAFGYERLRTPLQAPDGRVPS